MDGMMRTTTTHRRSLSTPVDVLESHAFREALNAATDSATATTTEEEEADEDEECEDWYDVVYAVDDDRACDEAMRATAKTKTKTKTTTTTTTTSGGKAAMLGGGGGGGGGVRRASESAAGTASLTMAFGKNTPMDIQRIALRDPKKAKRILANRISAARSKERKVAHRLMLERKARELEEEEKRLTVELAILTRVVATLGAENSALDMLIEFGGREEPVDDDEKKAPTCA